MGLILEVAYKDRCNIKVEFMAIQYSGDTPGNIQIIYIYYQMDSQV